MWLVGWIKEVSHGYGNTLNWEKQKNTLSKGTAQERKGPFVVTVYIITVLLGVLRPGFVNQLVYLYDIVVNLMRFSRFLFQEIVSSQEGKALPY